MMRIEGAFTALITPFSPDGERPDLDRLRANVEAQAKAGIHGVVPCGTTGETPTLEPDEYATVVETVVEQAHALKLLAIPGAGSNATRHAVEQHRFAHSLRADAALHVNPYYNRPSQEGLYRHFMTIADACDLPIVLYNIPGRTGVLMTFETVRRLAAHPNIVAIKDATGGVDLASQIAAETDLVVLSGDDPLTLPLAAVGGRGVISVASNLVPGLVADLVRAILSGDFDQARTLHQGLLPIARALLTLDSNPVPVKTALRLAGRDSGAVRLPLCEMAPEAVERLRSTLVQSEILSPAMVTMS